MTHSPPWTRVEDRPVADETRVRIHHLARAKQRGEKLTMLTAYDAVTARIFDEAGIDLLLVGDSIGNTMLGLADTLTVTLDDMARATQAVASVARRSLVVADLPFGTYQDSPAHAFASAVRLIQAGAHAVKLEGGARLTPQIELLTGAGIPVIGHLGFTPQSVHSLGGARVQGRDAASAAALTGDAEALAAAGASAIVVELVPAALAADLTRRLAVPTIGIGAGPDCDAQVLVWTDMAGLTPAPPRFVQTFGRVGRDLAAAAGAYAAAVREGAYPGPEHSF